MATTDCVILNQNQVSINTKKEGGKDGLPRSMKPLIPEPLHRIPPQGVTSGMSFRSLPEPSLAEIRKICQHYEAKCSGQYNSLGSRYVLDLAKEIKSQIDGMEQKSNTNDSNINLSRASQTFKKLRKRQGSWLEDMLSSTTAPLDQHDTSSIPFWQSSDDGHQLKDGFVCHRRRSSNMSSSTSHTNKSARPKSASFCYSSQEIPLDQQVHQLTQMLLQKDSELQFVKEDAVHAIEIHRKQFQLDLDEEKAKFQRMKEIMEQDHKNDIQKIQQEVQRVKNDAKLVIDFVRRKANKAIEDEKSNSQLDRKHMENRFLKMELKMKEQFNEKLQKAETVIQNTLTQQRFKIEKKKNHDPPLQCAPSVLAFKKTKLKKDMSATENEKVSTVSTTISDDSTCNGRDSDESISTRSSIQTKENDKAVSLESSQNGNVMKQKVESEESDKEAIKMVAKNKWFQDRLDELEEWTEALTLAIRTDKRPHSSLGPRDDHKKENAFNNSKVQKNDTGKLI